MTWRAGLLTGALVLLALPAAAWTHAFEDGGFRGTLDRDGDDMTGTCTGKLDRTVEQVLAVLTDYAHLGDWIPATAAYQGQATTGLDGRYRRTNRMPFFLPDAWADVEAHVEKREDGTARVTWHRVAGTVKAYDATWELVPVAGGTEVTYRVVTTVALPAPAFMLRRVASGAIRDTVKGLFDTVRARAGRVEDHR